MFISLHSRFIPDRKTDFDSDPDIDFEDTEWMSGVKRDSDDQENLKEGNINVKRLFLVLLLSLLTGISHAQDKIRLTIGPTISYYVNAENSSPKIGISVGITKDYHLYNQFLLYTGIGFSSRGAI